jgi:hypothetical protein
MNLKKVEKRQWNAEKKASRRGTGGSLGTDQREGTWGRCTMRRRGRKRGRLGYGRRSTLRGWGHGVRGRGGVANGFALLGTWMGVAVSYGWVLAAVHERVRVLDVGSRVWRWGMEGQGVSVALGWPVAARGWSMALEMGVWGRERAGVGLVGAWLGGMSSSRAGWGQTRQSHGHGVLGPCWCCMREMVDAGVLCQAHGIEKEGAGVCEECQSTW